MLRALSLGTLLSILFAPAIIPARSLTEANSALRATVEGDRLLLANDAIEATWSIHNGSLRWQSVKNQFTGATLQLDASAFELTPKEGAVAHSFDLKIVTGPVIEELAADPTSPRAAAQKKGRQ